MTMTTIEIKRGEDGQLFARVDGLVAFCTAAGGRGIYTTTQSGEPFSSCMADTNVYTSTTFERWIQASLGRTDIPDEVTTVLPTGRI